MFRFPLNHENLGLNDAFLHCIAGVEDRSECMQGWGWILPAWGSIYDNVIIIVWSKASMYKVISALGIF